MAPQPVRPVPVPVEFDATMPPFSTIRQLESDLRKHLDVFRDWQRKIEYTLEQCGITILEPTTDRASSGNDYSGSFGFPVTEIQKELQSEETLLSSETVRIKSEFPENLCIGRSLSVSDVSSVSDYEIGSTVSMKDSQESVVENGLSMTGTSRVEVVISEGASRRKTAAVAEKPVRANSRKRSYTSTRKLAKEINRNKRSRNRRRAWNGEGGQQLKNIRVMRSGPFTEYKCFLCGRVEVTKMAAISHVRRVHRSKRRLRCSQCSGRFQKRSDLERHIKFRHSETTRKSSVPVSRSTAGSTTNPVIRNRSVRSNSSNSRRNQEAKQTHNDSDRSSHLVLIKRTQDDIYKEAQRSYAIFHNEVTGANYMCIICGTPFYEELSAHDHVIRNHKCLYCPESLADFSELDSHMRQCSGLPNYYH